MAAKNPPQTKRYFTVAEANARLPLIRAIVRDIAELAGDLRERYERLNRVRPGQGKMADVYQEEMQPVQDEFDRDQAKLQEYVEELNTLGVYLKDPQTGLLDFPCWMDDHEVYLCWRLGEPEVAHWHEIEDGFAGRKKLIADTAQR